MARKGLPAKYAKMGFARGWKAYKASKRKTGKSVTKKKGTTMAKTKSKVKRAGRAVAAKVKYVTRKQKMKPMDLIVFSGIAAVGGLVSSLIVNFTPWVKDLKPIVKSLSQLGIGLVGTIFIPKKADFLKPVAAGAGIAGVFGTVQKLSAGRFQVLAGNTAKTLTDQEIAALVSGGYINLNGPSKIGLNGPVDLGRTVNPSMTGARNPAFMGFEVSN